MENILKPILSVKNLRKQFVGKKGLIINALDDVSLDLYSGEIFGLLGPNGAGKTTLSSILMSLVPPTSGDVLYDGQSVYNDMFKYRRQIGYCPQKPNLYGHLTVRQNLFFTAKMFGLSDEVANSRVEILLKRYSLTKYQDQLVSILSGGYKQRALIARSIVHDPKIVLFDEPTVGLDPHIRRELWEEIKQLKASGVLVILTTHYLDEAEYLSDRVCVLMSGQIKFLDTPENLKKNLNKNSLEELIRDLFLDE